MINVTYVDTTCRVHLGTFSPSDLLRFLGNLTYSPKFILVREHGVTVVG
jgi:hypothetical protein